MSARARARAHARDFHPITRSLRALFSRRYLRLLRWGTSPAHVVFADASLVAREASIAALTAAGFTPVVEHASAPSASGEHVYAWWTRAEAAAVSRSLCAASPESVGRGGLRNCAPVLTQPRDGDVLSFYANASRDAAGLIEVRVGLLLSRTRVAPPR